MDTVFNRLRSKNNARAVFGFVNNNLNEVQNSDMESAKFCNFNTVPTDIFNERLSITYEISNSTTELTCRRIKF